jgi:hypothetical protein
MNYILPILEVYSPDNKSFVVELDKDRITIGRFREFNVIGLEPDPQQLITRKAHCIVEHQADAWWVVDNGSVNRTFLRREDEMKIVHGRTPIEDGDTILILGRLTDDGSPIYWELVFRDPLKTRRVHGATHVAYLEYDWIQAKLFRVQGSSRDEVQRLRPQEHKFIRYMDQRNRANGDVPVMCMYEELITAIWGDEVNHTESEVNHLVYELRQKVEFDSSQPQFLESVRGLGYRLVTHPSVAHEEGD